MSGAYVQHITTNLKTGADVDLGKKVIIKGRNGAGKSTVVDAVSLVTTGAGHSPGVGRGNVLKRNTSDGDKAFIVATLDNGETVEWPTSQITGGVSITDVARNLLFGSPKAIRKTILAAVGAEDKSVKEIAHEVGQEIKRRVPEVYHDVLYEMFRLFDVDEIEEGSGAGYVIEQLTELLKKEKRATSSKLDAVKVEMDEIPVWTDVNEAIYTSLEGIAQRLGGLDNVQERIKHLKDRKDEFERQAGILQQDASSLEARVAQARESAAKFDNALYDMTVKAVDAIDQYLHMKASHGVQDASGRCPICGGQVNGEMLRQRREQIVAASKKMREGRLAVDSLSRELTQTHERLTNVQNTVKTLDTTLAELKDRMTAIFADHKVLPDDYAGLFGELREKKEKIARAEAVAKKANDLMRRKDALDTIMKVAQSLSGEETENVLALVNTKINRLLPPNMRVEFVSRGSTGVDVLARIDDGPQVDFRALGGAERAIVTAAFASAFGGSSAGEDASRLLIIDDVWLDRTHTTDLLRMVDVAMEQPDGPTQAVVAVVDYAGNPPEGWQVIDLDKQSSIGSDGEKFASVRRIVKKRNPKKPSGFKPVKILDVMATASMNAPLYFLGEAPKLTTKTRGRMKAVEDNEAYGVFVVKSKSRKTGEESLKARFVVKADHVSAGADASLGAKEREHYEKLVLSWYAEQHGSGGQGDGVQGDGVQADEAQQELPLSLPESA